MPIARPDRLVIRRATEDDELALLHLASLDSASALPRRPLLLAEFDGRLAAAMSITTGSAIADPFTYTADVLPLLALRAAALTGRPPGRRHDFVKVTSSSGWLTGLVKPFARTRRSVT